MSEYNELTKRLLAEGYSIDRYPDYVRPAMRSYREDPLDNIYGGFEYMPDYIRKKVFKTPCGIMGYGSSCSSNMACNGIEWTFENDLAHIYCPLRKKECSMRHPKIPDPFQGRLICNVHQVDEEYVYEGSIEDYSQRRQEEINRKKQEFIDRRRGCACELHMRFDEETDEWMMIYDPKTCASHRCMGRNWSLVEGEQACPIMRRPLDKAKGNVFYDLKLIYRDKSYDGTFWDGKMITTIQRGIKVFNHPVSLDICKNYIKVNKKKDIEWHVRSKYHRELYFAEHHPRNEFEFEVLNVRAEKRVARDLEQDLRDISSGIKVYYDVDLTKEEKARKKHNRELRQQKSIEALEKKILKVGYENLDEATKRRIDKKILPMRIKQLQSQRDLQKREDEAKPVQLGLFD